MDEDLLDEIFTNNETDEECLKVMLEVWLQKSTNPTWKDVTDALSKIGKNQLNHRCRITVVTGAAEAAQKWSVSKQRDYLICQEGALSMKICSHYMRGGTLVWCKLFACANNIYTHGCVKSFNIDYLIAKKKVVRSNLDQLDWFCRPCVRV